MSAIWGRLSLYLLETDCLMSVAVSGGLPDWLASFVTHVLFSRAAKKQKTADTQVAGHVTAVSYIWPHSSILPAYRPSREMFNRQTDSNVRTTHTLRTLWLGVKQEGTHWRPSVCLSSSMCLLKHRPQTSLAKLEIMNKGVWIAGIVLLHTVSDRQHINIDQGHNIA
jgi:hypothetical protein